MSGEKRLKKRRIGVVPAIGVAVLLLAALDFVLFANRAAKADHSPEVTGDAIVALTGGSGLRIAAGVELVMQGRGARLLISGVNPDVPVEDLITLAGGAADVWAAWILAMLLNLRGAMPRKPLPGHMSATTRSWSS